MVKRIFVIIGDIINYIFEIKLFDVPYLVASLAIGALIGYCASLIVIGFPCSIFEAITKKKINDEVKNKIIKIVAICFVAILWFVLLHQLSS